LAHLDKETELPEPAIGINMHAIMPLNISTLMMVAETVSKTLDYTSIA
jgi:hypothetical protein